ncbi:MAG: hypothetical protein AB7N70_20710 [Dehalococcoidia bacterium]
MSLASLPGEIQVDGHTYALGQVRAVLALTEPERATISRRMYDLVVLSGVALAALSALRFWM